MRIRRDLVGVVVLTTAEGATLTLNPGDEVPEGVEVGDHLTVAAGEAPDDANPGDEVPETPKRRTRKR